MLQRIMFWNVVGNCQPQTLQWPGSVYIYDFYIYLGPISDLTWFYICLRLIQAIGRLTQSTANFFPVNHQIHYFSYNWWIPRWRPWISCLRFPDLLFKDVRFCVLRTLLDRSCISKILHHISFPLVNLGFRMPIKLYANKKLRWVLCNRH